MVSCRVRHNSLKGRPRLCPQSHISYEATALFLFLGKIFNSINWTFVDKLALIRFVNKSNRPIVSKEFMLKIINSFDDTSSVDSWQCILLLMNNMNTGLNETISPLFSKDVECEIGQLTNALISKIGTNSLEILNNELSSLMNKKYNYENIVNTLSVDNLLTLLLSFKVLNNDCFYVHNSIIKGHNNATDIARNANEKIIKLLMVTNKSYDLIKCHDEIESILNNVLKNCPNNIDLIDLWKNSHFGNHRLRWLKQHQKHVKVASQIIFSTVNLNDVEFCHDWSVLYTFDLYMEAGMITDFVKLTNTIANASPNAYLFLNYLLQNFKFGDMKLVDLDIRMQCKLLMESKLHENLHLNEYDVGSKSKIWQFIVAIVAILY